MFSSAMIFTRETTPAAMRRGTVVMSCSTPSTRKRTRSSRPSGERCTSDAPALDGLGDDLVDELDDGGVFGGLVQGDDLIALLLLGLDRALV